MYPMAFTAISFLARLISAAPQSGGDPTGVVKQVTPFGSATFCLVVQDAIPSNGSLVVLGSCSSEGGWVLTDDTDTIVRWGQTDFCLDAGSAPENGVSLKVWECFGLGLQAQHWFYTGDKRIALAGQGLCTDLKNGDYTVGNTIQTWQCTDFNTNQIWNDGGPRCEGTCIHDPPA